MDPLDEPHPNGLGEHPADDRRPRLWRWLALVVVAGLALPSAFAWLFGVAPQPAIAPGAPAPSWELPSLSSSGEMSSDDLAGKIVVLNFWWSGCPPCQEEIPVLVEAYERYKDDGVVVVGIDAVRDSPADARAFMEEFGVDYPVVRDVDGELEQAFKINAAYPQTFFVDRQGRLAAVVPGGSLVNPNRVGVFGGITRADLTRQLDAMLREEPG